jgi:hypothetical protein
MDVFRLRDRLVHEYSDFIRSFLTIRDERIREVVEQELQQGLLWPDSLVQLNPGFQLAETVDEAVERGVLHETCRQIFRIKSPSDPVGRRLRLYKHQADAIRIAQTGASYVLTSGTGSGKSLTYLIPIVDAVLKEGPGRGKNPGYHRLPHERAGEQPGGRASQVPGSRVPRRTRPGAVPPLHRTGVG